MLVNIASSDEVALTVTTQPPGPEVEQARDLEQRVADLEALIEEARRRARRRRRRNGAAVLLLVAAGVAAFIGFGGRDDGGASTPALAHAPGSQSSAPNPSSRMLLSLRPTASTTWNVYADGRIIWQKWTSSGDATVVPDGASRLDTGYVQRRLTLQGVQRVRSKILSTGLFKHSLRLKVGRGDALVFHQVRIGDRIVTVSLVGSPDPSWGEHITVATPAQMRALASIDRVVADPARWLPKSVWADRRIRAFVPTRYVLGFDRGYPDLSKLPPRVGKVLAQYFHPRRHDWCQILATAQAKTLLQTFAAAGISPSYNHAYAIGFSLGRLPGQPHASYLHLSPGLPDARC